MAIENFNQAVEKYKTWMVKWNVKCHVLQSVTPLQNYGETSVEIIRQYQP